MALEKNLEMLNNISNPRDKVLFNDWHAVSRSQDLPSGTVLRKRLLGLDVVLWRHSNNQVLAWEDRCPHRGVPLSSGRIEEDTLVCAYHGLAFNSEGQCVRIPAHPMQQPPKSACVQTYKTQEQYGLVWVSLNQPDRDVPPLPEWDDPSYRRYLCGPYYYRTSGLRVIENFLDVAHFPFVHGGTLGANPVVSDYEVLVEPSGMTFSEINVWQPDPDGTGIGRLVGSNYSVFRPLTAYFFRESPEHRMTLFFTIAPVEEEECIGWMWISMNYAHDAPEDELRAFQNQVVAQDTLIVESQRPRRLPLSLSAEFHLSCDRGSIAYRKWLSELGVTFGVIAK